MQTRYEVGAFYVAVGLLLLIPLVAGLSGAFGGVKGMAFLFGVSEAALPPSLANNFRAVCFGFFSWTPLMLWSLASLADRVAIFRIIVTCAFLAGFARLTGWLVDGYPGYLPATLMFLELGGMPLLLFWHARVVRFLRGAHAQAAVSGEDPRAARSARA